MNLLTKISKNITNKIFIQALFIGFSANLYYKKMKNIKIIILIALIAIGINCNTINLPRGSGNPDTVNPGVPSRDIDTCYGFCRQWGPGYECKLRQLEDHIVRKYVGIILSLEMRHVILDH